MKKRIGNPHEFHVRREASLLPPVRRGPLNRATYLKGACLLLLLSLSGIGRAQNVAINSDGSKPNPNAILDIKSASKGLLIPRMTTEARTKIPNTQGLLVYDVNTNSFWYNTGKEWQNMDAASLAAASVADSAWLLTGNAGTVDNVNFIGTTDNVPFNVRVNNQGSGRIDPTLENTFWGYRAGSQTTTGKNNTAIGSGTFLVNTTGFDNTAVGQLALLNNSSGFSNSAFGRLTLEHNTTGSYNTAVGQAALENNFTGSQ
ncbi:MAG TPA: hypothetical protein VEB42_14760, partial [Chitinophagaceae bacterium]|nr:hypothetical protein [Chitinophagaceae bacterium]